MGNLAPISTPRIPMYINDQMTIVWQAFFRDITRLVRNTTNLQIYANNAAAIAGGLVVGDFYRTGADPDVVCVVH